MGLRKAVDTIMKAMEPYRPLIERGELGAPPLPLAPDAPNGGSVAAASSTVTSGPLANVVLEFRHDGKVGTAFHPQELTMQSREDVGIRTQIFQVVLKPQELDAFRNKEHHSWEVLLQTESGTVMNLGMAKITNWARDVEPWGTRAYMEFTIT